MKTVLIYDQLDADLKFFVLDGDYTKFKGVYINQCSTGNKREQKAAEKKQDELTNLLYDQNTGELLLPFLGEFPTEEVRNGAAVIVAGFLP